MVNLLKALVILTLLSAIGGGGWGAYYLLVERPKLRDAADLAAVSTGQPTPDPSTPDFEKALALKRDLNYPEARAALETLLIRYPDTSHYAEAENLLGSINLAELFSGRSGPGKTEYVVQRGDVLDHVAHKTKSDAELIYQANNLDRIMLRIGQKLQIPAVDFALEVHLDPKRLVVLNHGHFFKAYPLLDTHPLPKKGGEVRTKVQEKIASRDGRRVVFGSKEFPGSLRSLLLAGQSNFTIYAQPDSAPAQDTSKPAATGLSLAPADAEELHALVSVGTPVVITNK